MTATNRSYPLMMSRVVIGLRRTMGSIPMSPSTELFLQICLVFKNFSVGTLTGKDIFVVSANQAVGLPSIGTLDYLVHVRVTVSEYPSFLAGVWILYLIFFSYWLLIFPPIQAGGLLSFFSFKFMHTSLKTMHVSTLC